MKALITGVSGFCGAHLVSRLRRETAIEIAGLDQHASPHFLGAIDHYLQADLTDSDAVLRAVEAFRPDWVFHLAGLSGHSALAAALYRVNINGAINLLEAIRTSVPAARVLLAGSAAEYGSVQSSAMPVTETAFCCPSGPYGISKYAATLIGLDYARQFKLNILVARPSNIIGPRVPASLVVGAMISRAKQSLASAMPVMKVGDFDSRRDFVAVEDVMDAYVRLLKSGIRGEIFNICSGEAHSIRAVAEMLVANSRVPIRLEFDPDLVPASPVRCLYGSYAKAAGAIGFRPMTSLKQSLREAWSAAVESGVTCA
jgi:GDP-4-dehydro-6-deoxy-D-mannose reductase